MSLSRFANFKEFLDNTNFKELKKQGRTVGLAQAYLTNPDRLSPDQFDQLNADAGDDLEGLLNFLDEFRDLAKDLGYEEA